jgi:hypothetical protein
MTLEQIQALEKSVLAIIDNFLSDLDYGRDERSGQELDDLIYKINKYIVDPSLSKDEINHLYYLNYLVNHVSQASEMGYIARLNKELIKDNREFQLGVALFSQDYFYPNNSLSNNFSNQCIKSFSPKYQINLKKELADLSIIGTADNIEKLLAQQPLNLNYLLGDFKRDAHLSEDEYNKKVLDPLLTKDKLKNMTNDQIFTLFNYINNNQAYKQNLITQPRVTELSWYEGVSRGTTRWAEVVETMKDCVFKNIVEAATEQSNESFGSQDVYNSAMKNGFTKLANNQDATKLMSADARARTDETPKSASVLSAWKQARQSNSLDAGTKEQDLFNYAQDRAKRVV